MKINKLDESFEDKKDVYFISETQETVERYLDVEIPDICGDVLGVTDTLSPIQLTRLEIICRKFYNDLAVLVENDED